MNKAVQSTEKSVIRVMLVEDDDEARALFVEELNAAQGIRCIGDYACAEDAIRALKELRPHLLITDINLPGLSGIDLVRKLKPEYPSMDFIMLTMYSDSQHLFDALEAGACGYLLKRTSTKELIEAVHSTAAGHSPMSGPIARKVVQFFHPTTAKEQEPADYTLSTREQQVLQLLAQGLLYKEIAEDLKISVLTVNTHVRNIYDKMHVRSRAQAVAKMVQRSGRF